MAFPSPDRFEQLLSRFPGQKVLVVGDLMLDRYLWGDTARISPEAPVPVIEAREESHRLGGAANVAHNVRALGGEAMLVGVIGNDASGTDLRALLGERAIALDGLVIDAARRTTSKTRVLARHQQIVRIDREDPAEVEGSVLAELEARSVLITRGEQGMTLFREASDPLHFPALAREVFDVTGAGDTVVSTLAMVLGAGGDLAEAAALSNHAAGIVVREVGTAVTSAEELRRAFLDAGERGDPHSLRVERPE